MSFSGYKNILSVKLGEIASQVDIYVHDKTGARILSVLLPQHRQYPCIRGKVHPQVCNLRF